VTYVTPESHRQSSVSAIRATELVQGHCGALAWCRAGVVGSGLGWQLSCWNVPQVASRVKNLSEQHTQWQQGQSSGSGVGLVLTSV
jgi:hypothetical protein